MTSLGVSTEILGAVTKKTRMSTWRKKRSFTHGGLWVWLYKVEYMFNVNDITYRSTSYITEDKMIVSHKVLYDPKNPKTNILYPTDEMLATP